MNRGTVKQKLFQKLLDAPSDCDLESGLALGFF